MAFYNHSAVLNENVLKLLCT